MLVVYLRTFFVANELIILLQIRLVARNKPETRYYTRTCHRDRSRFGAVIPDSGHRSRAPQNSSTHPTPLQPFPLPPTQTMDATPQLSSGCLQRILSAEAGDNNEWEKGHILRPVDNDKALLREKFRKSLPWERPPLHDVHASFCWQS